MAHHPRWPFVWSDGSPTAESPGRENSAPDARTVGPTPTRSSIDAGGGRRGGNGSRVAARPSARARTVAVEPTRPRGTAWRGGRPAREGAAQRGGCPVPKLGNSTPSRAVRDGGRISSFDMVPDGLRAQGGQLFGGRGLLYGGRGARWAA